MFSQSMLPYYNQYQHIQARFEDFMVSVVFEKTDVYTVVTVGKIKLLITNAQVAYNNTSIQKMLFTCGCASQFHIHNNYYENRGNVQGMACCKHLKFLGYTYIVFFLTG